MTLPFCRDAMLLRCLYAENPARKWFARAPSSLTTIGSAGRGASALRPRLVASGGWTAMLSSTARVHECLRSPSPAQNVAGRRAGSMRFDRIVLAGYVSRLQSEGMVVRFLLGRGFQISSPALSGRIGAGDVRAIERFAKRNRIRVVHFRQGKSKELTARRYM
jgi:hypothetical protein